MKKKITEKPQNKNCFYRLVSLCIVITIVLCSCTQKAKDYDIKLLFLRAGQGDASLILTNDGHSVMIDTGCAQYTDRILASLLAENISELDLLVLTHNHEDHAAGALDILERIQVKELWCIEGGDSYITESIQSVANKRGTIVKLVNEGDEITLGKSTALTLKVLCAYAEGDFDDENENSIILCAAFGDFKALYMADASVKTEKYLLENRENEIKCDILKVAHHGSDSASSEEFIKQAAPSVAVISCEKNNQYAHPHQKTLETLNKYCEFTAMTYNGNFEVFVKDTEIIFNNKY